MLTSTTHGVPASKAPRTILVNVTPGSSIVLL